MRGALLIGAAVAGLGLYLWTSGGFSTLRTNIQNWREGIPLPPPDAPPVPPANAGTPLSLFGAGEPTGPLAWMDARPEDPSAVVLGPAYV
jgi:hypothetical protein